MYLSLVLIETSDVRIETGEPSEGVMLLLTQTVQVVDCGRQITGKWLIRQSEGCRQLATHLEVCGIDRIEVHYFRNYI